MSVHCSLAEVNKREKIGILYSFENVNAYKDEEDSKGFEKQWKKFTKTFDETYLNSAVISNISSSTKPEDLDVSVLLFPLAINISVEEEIFLDNFLKAGKKLVVFPGDGNASSRLKAFLARHGVVVSGKLAANRSFNLAHEEGSAMLELPIGSDYVDFEMPGLFSKVIGVWRENDKVAIGGVNNLVYIGYSWGVDASSELDIELLLKTLDYYWLNITSKIEKEIPEEEYDQLVREILDVNKKVDSLIKLSEKLDYPVPKNDIAWHLEKGIKHVRDLNTNYQFKKYLKVRNNANDARKQFSIAASLALPVRDVEVRAIWLDRGTIIKAGSESNLRKLIRSISAAGFNVIFFETINAGYPIYPSELLRQNPQVKGWDPLQVAIDESHKNDIELHAWVWTFAVGNVRHNLLIGLNKDYPGQVIAEKGMEWAMKTKDGKLIPDDQFETWVSPANKEATDYLLSLFSEIVTNYDVDGLQLDYIRYPFQKSSSQIGFDEISKKAFIRDKGIEPSLSGNANKIWKKWKIDQVNNFVKRASETLKKKKENLNISVAVFAIPRQQRKNIIQQDWEAWALNKWVDAVYPFYYSYSAQDTKEKLLESKKEIKDRALIIPAFNLRVINEGGLVERILESRSTGSLGISFFAAAHLNNEKQKVLSKGPFRGNAYYMPYRNWLGSSRRLINEFLFLLDNFTGEESVLSESKSKEKVVAIAKELEKEFYNYKPERKEIIKSKIDKLNIALEDWLSLEKYLGRDQRTIFVRSYFEQLKTLFNYLNK